MQYFASPRLLLKRRRNQFLFLIDSLPPLGTCCLGLPFLTGTRAFLGWKEGVLLDSEIADRPYTLKRICEFADLKTG